MTAQPGSAAEVILDVQDLTVDVPEAHGHRRVLDGVAFQVRAGETLAIMGESGAGKTMTALALLGLLPRAARLARGRVLWKGTDLVGLSPEGLRRVRGAQIGIVFQDPMTSMHPTLRVDRQLTEALFAHRPHLTRHEAQERMGAQLERMGVPRARLRHSGHAFEWSGGMRQRALIAMAMAHRPSLLIADEPTTALDATTQAQVLELLRGLQRETGTSILLITHDAAVVAEMADRVVVKRAGQVVETGAVEEVLFRPRHPYTASLVAAQAPLAAPGGPSPPTVDAAASPAAGPSDLLLVDRLAVSYPVRGASPQGSVVRAVDDVSLKLRAGETLAIVGESGCGKSTLARSLVRLETATAGRIMLDGLELTRASDQALRAARRKIQIVFQDPYASLNPRRRVGDAVAQPLHVHGEFQGAGGDRRVRELLKLVGLPAEYSKRFPHELSGGERQRVAIARALAIGPRILVLDEPVSALDASTRAGILRLLGELQATHGLAFVLITHDLRVVRGLAHRLAVMYLGRIVEIGPAAELLRRPTHPYTQALLAAMPVLDRPRRDRPRLGLLGEVPDATAPPSGCRFHPRCALARELCARVEPQLLQRSAGSASACHVVEAPVSGPD